MTMNPILTKLIQQFTLKQAGLIGCHRRHAWDGESPQTDKPHWTHIRGNALLAAVGEKKDFRAFGNVFQVYMLNDFLLQFRGGPWRSYWTEDFFDTWTLIRAQHEDISRTIYVLREDRGNVSVARVDVPEELDWRQRYEDIQESYHASPPGRISKAGVRAQKVCRFCPHKQRCDALDQLHHDTQDWGASYPIP